MQTKTFSTVLVAWIAGLAPALSYAQSLNTVDHFVPHVSTVPAISGQQVALYVRQKVRSDARPQNMRGRVVLFVHGATVPSVPDFDLEYGDYNWMGFLARAGFNAYAMDLSGYGSSPRPMMDDPCNVDPKQQRILQGRPLRSPCEPHYASQFNTIHSDWDEIDTVVDYLRRTNGVERIHIIGWSAGGPRVGGYIAQHPEKIERVVLYAPSPTIAGPIQEHPGAGFPISLQTRDDLERVRWDPDVRCPGQIEPGVRDALWKTIMQWDRIGASWGPPEGVMRGRTAKEFGWTRELAAKVVSPTLVIVGEYDRQKERHTVYEQIASQDKVFLGVACASHFMLWEKQHTVLQAASLEWLQNGTLQHARRGELSVDYDGRYTPK